MQYICTHSSVFFPRHCWNCIVVAITSRSEKTSKLRVTGLCARNSSLTGEFPTQRGSNAEMFPFDDVVMNASELILKDMYDIDICQTTILHATMRGLYAIDGVCARIYIVRCRYNAVNFLQDHHKRCPIAHPLGAFNGFQFCVVFYCSHYSSNSRFIS